MFILSLSLIQECRPGALPGDGVVNKIDIYLPTSKLTNERVTGRKARGLQTEETGCKCQTFLISLKRRRKQTSDIFFPSLYKVKRRFLLKYCVAIMTPDFT